MLSFGEYAWGRCLLKAEVLAPILNILKTKTQQKQTNKQNNTTLWLAKVQAPVGCKFTSVKKGNWSYLQ